MSLELEQQLKKMGVVLAAPADLRFYCWQCDVGELLLTRELQANGRVSKASFVCEKCGDAVNIAPAPDGGGVVPGLTRRAVRIKTDHPKGSYGQGWASDPLVDAFIKQRKRK